MNYHDSIGDSFTRRTKADKPHDDTQIGLYGSYTGFICQWKHSDTSEQ
jgi:hypothetical protein